MTTHVITLDRNDLLACPEVVFPRVYSHLCHKIWQATEQGHVKPSEIVVEIKEVDWDFIVEMWASCYLVSQPKPRKPILSEHLVRALAKLLGVNITIQKSELTFAPAESAIRDFGNSMREKQVLEISGCSYSVRLIP